MSRRNPCCSVICLVNQQDHCDPRVCRPVALRRRDQPPAELHDAEDRAVPGVPAQVTVDHVQVGGRVDAAGAVFGGHRAVRFRFLLAVFLRQAGRQACRSPQAGGRAASCLPVSPSASRPTTVSRPVPSPPTAAPGIPGQPASSATPAGSAAPAFPVSPSLTPAPPSAARSTAAPGRHRDGAAPHGCANAGRTAWPPRQLR